MDKEDKITQESPRSSENADLFRDGRLFVDFSAHRNTVDLFMFTNRLIGEQEHEFYMALPLTLGPKEPEGTACEPFFSMSREQAQELIDALYSSGLRPTHTVEAHASLGAVTRHLNDMRTIAGKYLKVEFPVIFDKDKMLITDWRE